MLEAWEASVLFHCHFYWGPARLTLYKLWEKGLGKQKSFPRVLDLYQQDFNSVVWLKIYDLTSPKKSTLKWIKKTNKHWNVLHLQQTFVFLESFTELIIREQFASACM